MSDVNHQNCQPTTKTKNKEKNPFSFFNYNNDDAEVSEENNIFSNIQLKLQNAYSTSSTKIHSENIFSLQDKSTSNSTTFKPEQKKSNENPYSIFAYLSDEESINETFSSKSMLQILFKHKLRNLQIN
jgi:hypothetical protein